MLSSLRELVQYREFLAQFILQQLKTRYRGSVLGFLWTLLNPLLVILLLSFVFSYINNWDLRTFGLYFFSGYVPFMFFSTATNAGAGVIVGNPFYMTRIYVPRLIFPLAVVAVNGIDLGVGLALLMVLALLVGSPVTAAWASVPVGVLLLALFTAGLCLLFSATTVFLRDFQYLWGNLTFLLFFLCPILYPMERIPPGVRQYLRLNPLLPFLQIFQEAAFYGRLPSAQTVSQAALLAVAAALLGWAVFVRNERRFYLYL